MTATVPAWFAEGLCAQTDPELFFPEKGGSTRDAKETCGACPVRVRCRNWALDNDERFGVWGGLSEKERRRLRRPATEPASEPVVTPTPKTPRQPSTCGTRGGYLRHRRNGEQACGPCRQANTDADNRLRRTGTTKTAA